MRDARYDDNSDLDEVVADDVANFHLERLDNGLWWIGLEHQDGTTTHIYLAARSPSVTKVSGSCEFNQ